LGHRMRQRRPGARYCGLMVGLAGLERVRLIRLISCGCEVVCAFGWREGIEERTNGVP
jgi:hypothetical protein